MITLQLSMMLSTKPFALKREMKGIPCNVASVNLRNRINLVTARERKS